MIAQSFMKALRQLGDPTFRKVLFLGLLLAVVVFVALFFGLRWVMPEGVQAFDWEWVNKVINALLGFAEYPILFITAWLFFPAVVTMFMGLFLDEVIDAVEAKHYPANLAPRKVSMAESFAATIRLTLVIIVVNLLALPLYLLLIFTAIGPLILFLVINAYLLGREYFEMVAIRHFPHSDARRLRRARRDRSFLGGAVITLMFMVPLANLLAPLLAAAMMVHIFHDSIAHGKKA